MSFQLKAQHSQLEQAFVCGDRVGHDGVLVSKVIPITLDLFDTKQSPPRLDFLDGSSESKQKRGLIDNQNYNCEISMNRKNGNSDVPKLDLKLNLSPPSSRRARQESPSRSSASVSPPSSCVSSEYLSSPEACSMVLVGCPRCLMYVMLSEDDSKCPKCKSTVLLDFMHGDTTKNNYGSNNGSSKKTRKS